MTSRTRTVFWKELRETFRDKRVILSVVVSPLLVTPLLLIAMGFFVTQKVKSDRAETLPVGVVDEASMPGLSDALAEVDTLEVTSFETEELAKQAVTNRTARAILVIPKTAGGTLKAGEQITARLFFDGASDKSRTAKDRIEHVLRQIGDTEVDRRLTDRGLERKALKPIQTESIDLAPEDKVGGFILGTILPYVVILTAAFGGMNTAFDLCAGEKERGTMETLLVSPASRHEIILGKLATISVVSIIAAFCAITGLVLAIQGGFSAAKAMIGTSLAISYPAVATMLIVVIPLALMTSALLLIVSTFARNQKEAQAYVFPFMIIIILPAIVSSILGPEGSIWFSFVPILNTAIVMKQVLAGTLGISFTIIALVTSAIYAGLIMKLAVVMFERESVLFRA